MRAPSVTSSIASVIRRRIEAGIVAGIYVRCVI
jgi:hypothetical protein